MGMTVGLNPINTRTQIEHDLGGHCTIAGTLSGWFATELRVPDSFIESLLPGTQSVMQGHDSLRVCYTRNQSHVLLIAI
jgi:hypothetical protein